MLVFVLARQWLAHRDAGRTRRELAEHGFDGRCIERRRGQTRLVVEAVAGDG